MDRNLAKEFVLRKKAEGKIVTCRSTYTDEEINGINMTSPLCL